ncbi:MAG: SRPBCC family protein [Planctomycetes bacterium]|nr:SRPBCC family protein [Planctomycetota bacterium]
MVKHSRSARLRQHKPGISPAGIFGRESAPPMKVMRFALFAVFALFAAVFGYAYFKDSTWRAEGVMVIEAAPEKVLPHVEAPKRWLEWMPWCDPTADGFQASYEGPESGPGARMKWSSTEKHGELTILSVSPAEGVAYELELDGSPGRGVVRLEPYGTQTRVHWLYTGDLEGNLFARYFIGFMQKGLMPTLQKGLANLREGVRKDG